MAIGGSAQVAISNRKTLIRKRLHKQLAARRMLLEALEGRQLMAVGPQLLGIQPNQGSLLVDGQIRQIAPNELVFRFDDRVGLDPTTLDGIRIIRSGGDGEFERASMATDLGSNGQALVEFYAAEPGQVGNGIQISFTQVNRNDTRAPVVRVTGRSVAVEVNSNPILETRIEDLMRAFDPSVAANTVTNLVYGLRLRGSTNLGIGRSVSTTVPVVLGGANAAKVTTDFGTGANLQVRLNAKDSGTSSVGIKVEVTSRDFGGPGSPIVNVSRTSAETKITVELNSNTRFASTVNDFVAAINGNSAANALVEATLVSGSGVTRLGVIPVTYSPLVLSGVTDVEITPGYVGFGDTSREVVMRFAEALPDDRYRIEILGRGSRALLNLDGVPFNDGIDRAVSFELDLGAQIESIVPQPVERLADGKLKPNYNVIDVYFNNDDLIDPALIRTVNGLTIDQLKVQRPALFFLSTDLFVFQNGSTTRPDVLRPEFYQLLHLGGTLQNTDDVPFTPSAVRYFPDADRVSLTFQRELGALVNPNGGAILPTSELRLRIGTVESKPLPPVEYAPVADPNDSFSAADNLAGVFAPGNQSRSVVINSTIQNTTPFQLDFPGGSDEIGSRYNRMQDHFRRNAQGVLLSADAVDGTTTFFYNFQSQLGTANGSVLLNSITEQQKVRAREIFSLYERYLGVRFVETENQGLTIAVGDLRAIKSPFTETSLTSAPGIPSVNAPGGQFLESGWLDEGPNRSRLATVLDSQDFGSSTNNEFGGPFSRAVAQGIGNLLGLGSTDDLEGFTTQAFDRVLAPGVGTEIIIPGDAEIIHGQYLYRPDSKDVDLYRFNLTTRGTVSIEAFAERMSQASLLDTFVRLYRQLDSGKWEEIAANDDYYSSDSFIELELGAGNYIVGVSASGNTQYDPTIADSGLGGRSQGQYQLRLDYRAPASQVLRDAGTLQRPGVALDGDADGTPGGVFDYWFRPSTAANTKYVDKRAAAGGNGSIDTPFRNIRDALLAAQPGDVVRIVGNGGADNRINTPADNLPYEIGFNSLGQPLPDGTTLDVPKDVSVFIDAGAILKLRRARVGVGSTSNSVDRSAGSLVVLGAPVLVDSTGAVLKTAAGTAAPGSVYFTSLNDTSLGVNASSGNLTTPSAGDWGGLDFRNRIDSQDELRKNFESRGQFLNWVSHADIRFGGGQVVIDGVSQVVNPIQMVDSRPTIAFSTITTSADAAMSATPNSFKETNFHSPDEQRVGAFTSDYRRVGPEIHGNVLTNNSLNGLLVRVRTGNTLETMTVAGRMDDSDIVHIIPENLIIAGTPGGFVSDSVSPPSLIVSLTAQPGGTLAAGKYTYRLTYVDASGNESVASEATQEITLAQPGSILLQNLPAVRPGSSYVSRRLYRSDATGSSNYILVRELNANSTSVVDNGSALGSPLIAKTNSVRSRLDGRLAVDGGTVVKLQGSRIEVQFGSQLIAEGNQDRAVVFTSVNDRRYGAGGTFSTSASSQAAAEGNWGGIYLAPTSTASFDHAVIAYGGGTTRIEGGFADFGALEAHQADLRLSNSRLELNASGSGNPANSDRGGRGTNDDAVVFVRGAQPVLVDNVVVNNRAAAFSINVSALNSTIVSDPGRSTGEIGRVIDRVDNQGPLIVGNRMDTNNVNGLVIRGGVLTTEGVWDDTDIVHVVQEQIDIPNFHTYGGLRLESSPTQSLVVKLLGAGITANGELLDNADRIGGALQLIGTPGNPVMLTSLNDCTVGVGFTPDGRPQTNTLNQSCGSTTVSPFADVIVVMDDSGSMEPAQQFSSQLIRDLDAALIAAGVGSSSLGANRYGLVAYGGENTEIVPEQILLGGGQWGTPAQYATGINTLQALGAIEDGYMAIDYALTNYSFRPNAQKFVLLVTNEDRDIVDTSKTFATTLTKLRRQGAILDGIVSAQFFDSRGRDAIALDARDNAYLADGNGGFTVSPNGAALPYFFFDTTIPDYVDLIHATGGIAGDIEQIQFGGLTTTSFSNAMITTLVAQASGNEAAPGDWSSLVIGANSNDRNVAVASELESPKSNSPRTNDTTEFAQYLGELATDEKNGDEIRRLGYQLQGVISNGTDVDIYSFKATAGTEVWLDIDRTLNSLDTIVELVDADGQMLAMSNDSLAEEDDPTLLISSSNLPRQSVHSLRKTTPELYLKSALDKPKDLYSTNPRDAGMRVVLPGEPGSQVLYHVRVRSGGLTRGQYQLQIRLREKDEIPGTSVTYADMRYAGNALVIEGTRHSPLLGETAEIGSRNNNTSANAQAIGNLLVTDKQAISIAGSLEAFNDVDWFSFSLDYTAIRATELRKYFSTVFDMDYADGVGRPDTSIYVFDASGRLILGGLSSNLLDDQATGLSGAGGVTDVSRGSAGSLDPFVGAVELPAGQYFLAVTSSEMIPRALTAYLNGGATTLRMQPTNGVQLIAEDRLESGANNGGATGVPAQVPVLFPRNSTGIGQVLDLSEVPLFVSRESVTNETQVSMVNARTGQVSNTVGRFAQSVRDIAFRSNGELQAFDISPQPVGAAVDQDTIQQYLQIDPVAGGTGIAVTSEGDLGISTFFLNNAAPPAAVDADDGIYPNALAFTSNTSTGQEKGFIVGSRGELFPRGTNPTFFDRPNVDYLENVIYQINPATGAANSGPNGNKTGAVNITDGAGTAVREFGFIRTASTTPGRGLIAREATRVVAGNVTQRVLRDGDRFTITDSSGFTNLFEFDSGPDVFINNYNPATTPALLDGAQFTLDGITFEFETAGNGVTPGAIAIPVALGSTQKQFVDAIARVVGGGVVVSNEGNRLNFSGAQAANFTQVVNRGVFIDSGATGSVSASAIKIAFLASDSAADVAARMAQAINSSGIPGLNASASGVQVNLIGGTASDSNNLQLAGAPGGTITGATFIGGNMFAVSDRGGLYRVDSSQLFEPSLSSNPGAIGSYVSTSHELLGIQFAGLTTGPANIQGGAFARVLFGIDINGVLYAFNESGQLLPVFAGGATSVATGLTNANGLSFSTLNQNLWHVSGLRGADAGHGLPATPDGSQITPVSGGNSLYFGTEQENVANRNYNFPGGAAGAVESQVFDLSGVSIGDKPTLYFNYFLATENASATLSGGTPQFMRDALRVYVAGDDGQWVLAATNNSGRGAGLADDEYDPLISGNSQGVQELFDNTGSWRQARIPLDDFAGQSNVRLRVEFSSAASFGYGMQGGKGPQLRTKSADELLDGQTLRIGNRTFELKFGPVLSMPAGSGLTPGQSITIEGVTYVFTDGSVAVTSPNVGVTYSTSMSASQVAEQLRAAVAGAARPQTLIDWTAAEQNDTLATALVATTNSDSALVTIDGAIGDNPVLADKTQDVDLVRIELARGATVTATVDAAFIGSPLDSYLRLFDSLGNQLRANDNSGISTDSQITFTAPQDGTYYFGVSGSGNSTYLPGVLGTASGAMSGAYRLKLSIMRQLNPVVKDERLQLEGATQVSVPFGSSIVLVGSASTANAPIYLNLNMTANDVAQAVQQALATTYASGNALPFIVRGDTVDLTGFTRTQVTGGPFTLITELAGDQFGSFNTGTDPFGNTSLANPGLLKALNNNFEGVHLDDFMIGLAGRGEMVSQAPQDTEFVPVAGAPSPNRISQGPYQLEIRGGTEYGVPLPATNTFSTLQLATAISPLERLGQGVALNFNGASGFVAGTTFTVSDGTRSLVFELDNVDDAIGPTPGNVPLTFSNRVGTSATGFSSESALVIARRFADLINSPTVQAVLDLQAILINGSSGLGSSTVALIGQANVEDKPAVYTRIFSKGTGDANREREQGQIVIQSARISQSSGFGVSITSAGRDAQGNPIGGTPRNLLSINTDRLVPGPVIMNSTFIDNLAGGISISGDPTTGGVPAPVPYSRIINNTLVGTFGRGDAGAATEVGLLVTNNASPTLINNVIANFGTGLSIDASSNTTIVGGTVFHRNRANTAGAATVGQFAIVADNEAKLFRDVLNGNLYPEAGSRVIDSAIDSLQDRPSLVAVKSSIGISASPVLAPQYDVNGMLRVDDPSVAPPSGLGENVFKDRGSQDRADFAGPSVVMLTPVDNDNAGLDTNPAPSVIELTNFTASYFDIQLFDGLEPSDPNRGTGIDDSTVNSGSILVYKDGIPLVDGIDYRFGYDATTNVVRLTPLAGLFSSSSVYQIRFVNSREFAITALRGRDYADGSSITIVDADKKTTTFELDTGFLVSVPSADGAVADIVEGSVITIDDGVRRLTFELDKDGSVSAANVPVRLTATASPVEVARRLAAAITGASMQLTIADLGTGRLQIDGSSIATINVGTSGLTLSGKPGVKTDFGIQIPLVAGRPVALVDGETFTINRTSAPITFEIDTNGVVVPGRVPVRFSAGAGAATIGQALVTAIRNAGLGLLPSYAGNGLVVLGGDANTTLGLTNTQLLQAGTPGQAASRAIKISAASTVEEIAIANQITAAINAANLPGVTATAFGDRVVVAGAESVSGDQAALIQAISDMAGNVLKPNQNNGQTTLTVFMGEGLDYGDAPDPKYASKRDSNGARHTVVPGLSLGAQVRPDADAKTPNLDEFDDGVTFSTFVAAFQSSATIQITRPAGTTVYLSGWIDYNQDGVFAATEAITVSKPLTTTSDTLNFLVPPSALNGTTYARFRLSTDSDAVKTPTGLAPDGEVEDYAITIVGNPFKNQTNQFDVNADGKVSPIDVLQVINYYNSSAPKKLSLPHTAAAPYVDVNGDSEVTPLDVLLVINYLNTLPPTGSSEGGFSGAGEGEAGTGVADVSTLGWIDGIERLGSLRGEGEAPVAAPAIETKRTQVEETPDDFFASLADDKDEPVVLSTASKTSSTGARDAALASLSGTASELADEVVTSQANWLLRQRLASRFRR